MGTNSVTTTALAKRTFNRRPLITLRKMFKNRRRGNVPKHQRLKDQGDSPQQRLLQQQQEPEQHDQRNNRQSRNVFSMRKRNQNFELKCESPPRRMPKEIKITPGTPDSIFSAVSGATGLHTELQRPESNNRSMFKSVLPEMSSETEECSMDRSTYSWNSNNKTGKNSGSFEKRIPKVNNSARSSIGGYMIGGSSRSIFSDDSDVPSKKLFPRSPSNGESTKEKKSFLFRSKTFKNIINYTFESVDIDKSGTIDKKEIYSALLLIHLKLAAYVGPAACRPVSKEYVFEMFDLLDINQSGTLDKEEFTILMTILCSQITTRVFMQLSMTLLIVPFLSQYLVDCIRDLYHVFCVIVGEIDDHEVISEFIWKLILHGWVVVLSFTPPILQRFITSFYEGLSESFMDSMPLTIMSSLLGCMIVPWLLYKSDDFYNQVAVNRSTRSINRKA